MLQDGLDHMGVVGDAELVRHGQKQRVGLCNRLVRPELLALHNIAVKNQPEYYLGCAQVHLSSSGSAGPESTVSIPGYTSMSDSANQYNAFDKPLKPFTVQGPKVVTPTNSLGSTTTSTVSLTF